MKKFILLFSLLLFLASPALPQRGGKGIKGQFKQLEVDQSIKLGGETILPFKIDTLLSKPSNPQSTSWECSHIRITHKMTGSNYNGIYCEFIAAVDRQDFSLDIVDNPGWSSDTISVTLATDSDTIPTTTLQDLMDAFDLNIYMATNYNWVNYNGIPPMEVVPAASGTFSGGTDGFRMDLPENIFYLYHTSPSQPLLLFKAFGYWYQMSLISGF